MKTKPIIAWHFVGDTLRDGRPVPPDGVRLVHAGPLVLCRSGHHASLDPFDALHYAPGSVLCKVECGGEILHADDKLVCTERTIIARKDATEGLRYFARQMALSVLDVYPGEPEQCVLDWLMGDEAARSAAWSAAESAARSAAWSAAESAAAWSAAREQWNALVREAFE